MEIDIVGYEQDEFEQTVLTEKHYGRLRCVLGVRTRSTRVAIERKEFQLLYDVLGHVNSYPTNHAFSSSRASVLEICRSCYGTAHVSVFKQ